MKWRSACICGALRNCFFTWIARRNSKRGSMNFWVEPRRKANERVVGMLRKILKEIEQRQRFLLTTHARPDGDGIGSALAFSEILRSMGKDAEVVLRDGVPRIYQQLPFANTVITAERVNGKYEAAILLECDSIQRTRLQGLENGFLINIDHHLSGRLSHMSTGSSRRRSRPRNWFT